MRFSSINGSPQIGERIEQIVSGGKAVGYVASWDSETNVLKYFRDRSLYYNQSTYDQQDYVGISTNGKQYSFDSSPTANQVIGKTTNFTATIFGSFTGISTNPTGVKAINLGVYFSNGLANPEINKGSGDIIYLDNRSLINRNSRQKEDIKIVLEF